MLSPVLWCQFGDEPATRRHFDLQLRVTGHHTRRDIDVRLLLSIDNDQGIRCRAS